MAHQQLYDWLIIHIVGREGKECMKR